MRASLASRRTSSKGSLQGSQSSLRSLAPPGGGGADTAAGSDDAGSQHGSEDPPTPTRPSTSAGVPARPSVILEEKPSTAAVGSRDMRRSMSGIQAAESETEAASGGTGQSDALAPLDGVGTDKASSAVMSPGKSTLLASVDGDSCLDTEDTGALEEATSLATTQTCPTTISTMQSKTVSDETSAGVDDESSPPPLHVPRVSVPRTSAPSAGPAQQSSKALSAAAKAVPPFVCPVTGEALKVYCHDEDALDCLICPTQSHTGHRVELLRDFCASQRAQLQGSRANVMQLLAELKALESDTPQRAERLHTQVDEAIDNLVDALNNRRKSLHDDIRNRSSFLISDLGGELSARKHELQRLESAKLTLTLLSNGRGVAPEGPIGDLLRGTRTYDEFLAIGDPEMPPAPTIKQLLNVRVPLKMREEILRFDWTAETRDDNPLVYPPKGF